MRERGRYQIQFMKTRSSSGVGQKVDLEFNIDTLRITDLDDDQELADHNKTTAKSPLANFKRTSNVSTSTEVIDKDTGEILPKPKGVKTATDIRNILASLNSEKD
jgi:hypothetical protein